MFGSHLSIAGGMHNALLKGEQLGCDTVQVFTKNQKQWKCSPLGEVEVCDWKGHCKRLKFKQTVSHDDQLPNYDIRSDKNAADRVTGFRSSQSRSAAQVADIRDSFARGEEKLKASVPSLKVEYNDDIRTPEVISPLVGSGRKMLTEAASGKRSDILVNFLRRNAELVGASDEQIASLKVFSDYTNPDGNLSFVELDQEIVVLMDRPAEGVLDRDDAVGHLSRGDLLEHVAEGAGRGRLRLVAEDLAGGLFAEGAVLALDRAETQDG
jgi:hypothetical protein